MRSKQIAAAAVAALAVAVAPVGAGAQDAAPAESGATVVSKKVNRNKAGTKATLKVKYTCSQSTHLWVSLKQSKNGKKDPALKAEGSSQAAATWLDSHRNKFTCDGKPHTQRFSVDKVEPGKKGKLRKGYAWLQFCLTYGDTEENSGIEVYKLGWVKVK
jgi:hypothetical protein